MLTENGRVLENYVDYANELFGDETDGLGSLASNGFIGYTSNCHRNIPSIPIAYGYENVYFKRIKSMNYERIKTIQEMKKWRDREWAFEHGLITREEIYEYFENLVYRQNTFGALLENDEGKRVIVRNGRYNNQKGQRTNYVNKRIKDGLEDIRRVVMLTTTIHQPRVEIIMPDNTNLLPVEYAIIHAGEWHSQFLRALHMQMSRAGLPWGYIGSFLQFQDEDDTNGFPHYHDLFDNAWMGKIDEIRKLWKYSEPQGVDMMTKSKWEKMNPGKKYTPLTVKRYLSGYLKKQKFTDEKKGIHKCHAWVAYRGGRYFNFAHHLRNTEKTPDIPGGAWKYKSVEYA